MIEPTIQPIGVEMLKENCDVVLGQDGSEAGLIRQINEHQIEALVTRAEQVTRKVIESCPSLKVIAQYGVGLDNINVAAASENGVMVLNVPDGNFISVAEHVMLSVLCLSRMVVNADHAVRAGEWSAYREAHSPQEIYEKTLLIIGFGRIGRDVAAKAQAFGMKVMAFDPFVTSKQMAALGVTKADPLEVGLREADYVTIHLHLTPETRGMISTEQFRQMKPTASLINLSRGPVVDQKALYQALVDHEIASAMLDVLEKEPPEQDEPLLSLPNVIFTPHLGGNTVDALIRISKILARTVFEALETGDSYNFANKKIIQNKRV